jgi:hypothetical protein
MDGPRKGGKREKGKRKREKGTIRSNEQLSMSS